MSDRTGIEWTERTWNPWQGCTQVSPGCAHCYMFTDKRRFGQDPTTVVRSQPATFNKPLHWRDPALVFTCSWSDWFHETADAWRAEAWEIIRRTPHLTYQVLTKRGERIRDHLPADWGDGYPNVWLGVTVENQHWADIRIPQLLDVPARVHFLSCEPLLGPVSLRGAYYDYLEGWGCEPECCGQSHPCGGLGCEGATPVQVQTHAVSWVIAGGESGPKCRATDAAWLRTLRDECAATGVAFFLKQLGGHPDKRGHDAAVLDGQRHVAMPGVVA